MHKILRHSIMLTFCGIALALMSARSHAVTGADIVKHCRNYQERPDKNLCNLYTSSVVEFANSSDKMINPSGKLCIGSDVPLVEIVETMLAWLGQNPSLHSSDAFKSTYGGLSQKYACR